MAIEYFSGVSTYVIFGEESAYGTVVNPSVSTGRIGRITNGSIRFSNNLIKSRGTGGGLNVQSTILGSFDVSGVLNWEVDDFNFLQYVIGTKEGTGVIADPYELTERTNFGYSATTIPTLTLEFGNKGVANDEAQQVDGVFIDSLTLNINEGQPVTASCNWRGRSLLRSTSIETYTTSSNDTFNAIVGYLKIATEPIDFTSLSLTISYAHPTNRGTYDRFLKQPTMGPRSYNFTITLRKKFDSTASTLSGTELLSYFLGDTNAPLTTGSTSTSKAIDMRISEGAASNDRVVDVQLSNAYFDTWDESWTRDGDFVLLTVTGHAHAGLTDGAVQVPIRWYAIA